MERNTLLAIVLSMLFLFLWTMFGQRPAGRQAERPPAADTAQPAPQTPGPGQPRQQEIAAAPAATPKEAREIIIDRAKYRAVFTTMGAAIKNWYIKEANGNQVDLLLNAGQTAGLITYPSLNFRIVRETPGEVVFSAVTPEGMRVTKTYQLSEDYLHTLRIETVAPKGSAARPPQIVWNAGLGTDERELAENLKLMRRLGFPAAPPRELVKFKPGEYQAPTYRWVAIDNRYFLAAFIFPAEGNNFGRIEVPPAKDTLPSLTLDARQPEGTGAQAYTLQFYLGPKDYNYLRTLDLRLEETVDFGFFGFLGKLVLRALAFFYGITGNYGWAIVILTIIIQIIVFPLSLKSFKASIAMKKLQPHMKALQEKYKGDPQRLNVEMLNLYKTQKVNPLSGCLPMILQLPIFLALYNTLRGAYELRGAPWILWVKDLSAPDTLFRIPGVPILGDMPFNVLPLVMGVGMLLQQKLVATSTDPMQARMMYLMPVIFTFIFWSFPAGLVLYWLVNNIMTLSEQYVIMKREEA